MSATVTASLVRWCRCGEWQITDRPLDGEFRCASCTANADAWPRVRRCARCGDDVLLARHKGPGRPFVLEVRELLPLGPCGSCRGRGYVTVRLAIAVDCYACKGSKVRGEEIPVDAVAVSAKGIGRRLGRDGSRRTGEAVHARHRCSRPPAP